MNYGRTCITCLSNMWYSRMKNCNNLCPQNYTLNQLKFNVNCTKCLQDENSQLFSSAFCQSCWIALGLASGKCVPNSASGLVFYANDLPAGSSGSSLWKGSAPLSSLTCTSDYINLLGIPQSANHSIKTPSSLNYTLTNLPAHRGITLVLNIFKIDDWLTTSSSATNNLTSINITVNSPGYQGTTFNITLTNLYGSNICSGSGREMIWALQANLNDHRADQVTMTIATPDEGIFVREVEVYLGNCVDCSSVGLAYEIFTIPMYSDNSTQTGLDLWITFNHPVYYNPQGNISQDNISDAFARSFLFSIDDTPIPNATLTDNKIAKFNYLKYFLPLSETYTNATIVVTTPNGSLVYTSDGSVTRQLTSSS